MTRRTSWSGVWVKRLASVFAILSPIVIMASCGSSDPESTADKDATVFSAELAKARQVSIPDKGSATILKSATVGTCVDVHRVFDRKSNGQAVPSTKRNVQVLPCSEAPLIVVQRAAQGASCIRDADLVVSETGTEGRSVALCLDYNWIQGNCLSVGDSSATVVDCGNAAARPLMAENLLVGSAARSGMCKADKYTYSERGFAVCVARKS